MQTLPGCCQTQTGKFVLYSVAQFFPLYFFPADAQSWQVPKMLKNKYLKCFTSTLNENVCIKAYPECRKIDKESLYFRLIHVNRNSHEFRSSHQSHSHVLLSVNIRQIFVRTSCHVTASRPQESKPADNIVRWMYPSSRHKKERVIKVRFNEEK